MSARQIPEPDVAVRSVAISADGRLLAAVNSAGHCYVWRVTGSEFIAYKKLDVHTPHYVLHCAFSRDGTRFVTTSADRTARVWDVTQDFALLHTLAAHKMWVWDCAIAADSATLVTGAILFFKKF